jgi:hypothetical protein
LRQRKKRLGEPTEDQKQSIRQEYGRFAGSEESLKNLFGARMHAMKNAGAKTGTFPIILYGPSPGGSAYDNVVLSEHVASYG